MMRTVHVAAAVIKSDRGILACPRAATPPDRDPRMDGGWLPADRTLAQSLGMNWDAAFGAEFL